MAFIRPYKETDFDACAQICIATLPPSLASSPEAARLSPYLWTHPYTYLSPSTCHVLDDGAGKAVGYCIGCPDVHAFAEAYPRYVAGVLEDDGGRGIAARPAQLETREPWFLPLPATGDDREGREKEGKAVNPAALAQLAYRADWLLLEGDAAKTELMRRWRATMHIDLLEPWQGRGWGRRLIEAFVRSVRESGADYGEGEHIGVAGENRKVVAFYERMGFRVISDDGGDEGTIVLVKDIE
ncbi:hypothetical protein DL770_004732 [Monosporascus sp. CRB-9-2]|nr:hypothetical protein DL770_004732 [Monosporascus sp. CRB-9-2]